MLEQLLKLVAVSAYTAWKNTRDSNCPATRHYYQRMGHPEVGDLVLETSSFGSAPIDQIGRLLAIEPDPLWPEDWSYRIQTLDNREYTWTNAQFIVIPEDRLTHPGNLNK